MSLLISFKVIPIATKQSGNIFFLKKNREFVNNLISNLQRQISSDFNKSKITMRSASVLASCKKKETKNKSWKDLHKNSSNCH